MDHHIQARIDEALSLFPCVALLGVRQFGKTTLLNNLPKNWKQHDMKKTSDRQLMLRDPDLFLRMNPQQVAIDEAQMVPALFPAFRVAIDDDRKSLGRFIITGTSSPELSRKISETLAGRIAILELSPFSIAEAYNFPISDLFYSHLKSTKQWTQT
jgi:predicted AAA+ superfamily ATPase